MPKISELNAAGALTASDVLAVVQGGETKKIPATRLTRGVANVLNYGVTGDGTTDDTSAIATALAASAHIHFPPGTYKVTSAITLPASDVLITGDNATLNMTGSVGVFKRTGRGYLTEIDGLKFTGSGPGFHYDAQDSLPHGEQFLEYRIRNCRFLQGADVIAVNLDGPREGSFENCYFETNDGVYLSYAINTDFIGCHFKNCGYGIHAVSGTEGIKVIGGTALGCEYVLHATGMLGIQLNSVMWDYNDAPVYILGSQQIGISNSYITARTTSPAIQILPNGATRCEDVVIVGNPQIAKVGAGAGVGDCIVCEDTDYLKVEQNAIKLWGDDGVVINGCTHVLVRDNNIIPYPSASPEPNYSVHTIGSDTTVVIENNTVTEPFSHTAAVIRQNLGYVSEATGEATMTSGSSSKQVAHGLAAAPIKARVKITPTTALVTATYWYVSAVDATNITVTANTNVGSNFSFAWEARLSP